MLLIKGHNDFYDGWLAAVLLQKATPNKSEPWMDGYRMAQETGLALAVTALQSEVQLGHIVVEPDDRGPG